MEVEVLGRYSNHADQGERLRALATMATDGRIPAQVRTTKRVCRRLTEVEIADLPAGYAAGTPIDELTARFQNDQTTVQKHVRAHGLPRRSARLGAIEQKAVAQLYRGGTPIESIAERFGIGSTTVRRALTRAGVSFRPRGRPRSPLQ